MSTGLFIFIFIFFPTLQCLSQGHGTDLKRWPPDPDQDPSIAQYFLGAVDKMNRPWWRFFLPEDTDIDQDGNLSDLEIQHKFNTYMGEVFKLIDHDKDNSIIEEEFRSLKLDISDLTKAIFSFAFENSPLKPFFLAADGNGDGVYDENDFYLPAKKAVVTPQRETSVNLDDLNNKVSKGRGYGVARIGQNEGTVICKSLGYQGLERVLESDELEGSNKDHTVNAYSCNGTEEILEDCQKVYLEYRSKERGMGVVCQLGGVRLVGGRDTSSGDIYFGKRGLTCDPWNYRQNNSQVICRELGYSGVLKLTRNSAFSDRIYLRKNMKMKKKFQCNGNEQKLAHCPVAPTKSDESCYGSMVYGLVCAKDGQTGIDENLSELIDWPNTGKTWENIGRFLFFADINGDGKLTLEELKTKGKNLMKKTLLILDLNRDGRISLEDINLNLSIGPLHRAWYQNFLLELFDDVTESEGEFDLYNIHIVGQDMSNIWRDMDFKDINGDGKINAADTFWILDSKEKSTFLLPMLSEKLDKNQDGKIQREELRQFIEELFDQLDMNKDGDLTLEDVYSLLRENGFDCLQVGALRSYIKAFLATADTDVRNFFVYIFHQFDIDGNGQISPAELEQMHVPCDRRYRADNNPDDPNARKECGRMIDDIFGSLEDLIRSFPDFIFYETQRRGRGGRESRMETLVDKLTNHACEMLT